MFKRSKLRKLGKAKYAYSRTPNLSGTRRRRGKKLVSKLDSKTTKKIKVVAIILVIILATSSITYYLFFSGSFTLEKIKTTQEGLEEKSTLFEPYFKDMRGKNLVLINTKEIREEIQAKHPEFENITIKKVYPNEIHIEINKYPATANVINIVGEIQAKHIVNSVGLSVQKNTENPNLPYIKIESDEPLNTENPLLEQDELEYIVGAIDFYEDKLGMKIFDAEFLKKAREIHLKTEKYFYIWMDTQKKYEDQILKLKKVVPKLDIQNLPLEYIDLRISEISGDKIIYKKR
jgi:hypothetical protein